MHLLRGAQCPSTAYETRISSLPAFRSGISIPESGGPDVHTRAKIPPLRRPPANRPTSKLLRRTLLDAIAAAGERLLKRVPEFHTLKPRQQAFIIEYVADFNAPRAASTAGYSSKGGIARALYFIRGSAPIAACLKALVAVVAARAAINLEGHLMQLAKLRDRALKLDL